MPMMLNFLPYFHLTWIVKMPIVIKIKIKCPICSGVMRYKIFVGAGNIQGYECVPCALIVGTSTLLKLLWKINASWT